VAFAHPEVQRSAGGPAWRPDEHERERWCRMLIGHGIPADPQALDLAPPAGPAAGGHAGATVLHPGAGQAARHWPVDRWIVVARACAQAGRRVLLTGSAAEVPMARAVARGAGLDDEDVLAGRTGLAELAALVAAARVVVCGDTGIAHLATALRVPSVLLFGPSSPAIWGPPPERPIHRVLWTGRTGDPLADHPDPGLLEISARDVLDALGVESNLPVRAALAQP
jgi:ADP-heptose:LPS heptosyltransferase